MSHDDNILLRQRETQARIFRLCQRDGLTLKAISLDSGLGYTTIQSYAHGEAVMSVGSLFKLIGVVPDEYLSLLMPEGRRIVAVAESIDHDEFSEVVRDYLDTKEKAHRTDSPAGPAICPTQEKPILDAKAAGLKAVGA